MKTKTVKVKRETIKDSVRAESSKKGIFAKPYKTRKNFLKIFLYIHL